MSQQNVELVERAWGGLAPTRPRAGFHPNIEWHLDASHPDQRVLRGIQDVAEYFRGWAAAFDEVRVEVGEYLDAGEHVVSPFVAHARPRGSKAEVALAETWTFKVRDGAIIEVREYLTKEAALKAIAAQEFDGIRGKAVSGAPLDLAWINVMWFRDGKMSRGAGYTSRRDALKAVGLEG